MTDRIKKLRIIQISLLVIGCMIIFFTYSQLSFSKKENIISQVNKEKIDKISVNQEQNNDVFFNIEYSGLDLAGNRYILKSKEAYNNKSVQEIVNMKSVEAIFYFKDDTVLKVWSDEGVYNNKTLDMKFNNNVRSVYENSQLFAQKAEYSNSNSFLSIYGKVKINDIKGTIVADKLLFDLKTKILNIDSFKDGKINANLNLK